VRDVDEDENDVGREIRGMTCLIAFTIPHISGLAGRMGG